MIELDELHNLHNRYAFHIRSFEDTTIVVYFGSAKKVYSMADRPRKMTTNIKNRFESTLNSALSVYKKLNSITGKSEICYSFIYKK